MIRSLLALLFAALTVPAVAQDVATITASHVTIGAGGALVPDGSKLCAMTTDANDRPAGYRIGSNGGQTSASTAYQDCHVISGGAMTVPLVALNSAASSQLNACIRLTLKDPSGAEIRHDKCAQTGTAAALATWCSVTSGVLTCNYDHFIPGGTANAVIQAGPPGPTGATGSAVPLTDANLAANTTAVLSSNSSHVQFIPNLATSVLNGYQPGEYLQASRPLLHGWMNALHYAGTVQQHIIWMNTSFSRCDQNTCGTGPDIEAHRVPSIVRDDLAARYGYAVPGHGIVPVRSIIGDPRIDADYYTTSVSTSALSNDCRLGPQQGGNCTVVVFPSGATLTYTSRVPIDRVAVDCMTDSASGTWSVSIDGASAVNACGTHTGSATAIRTEIAAAGYALHSATATCGATPCYMWAMEGLAGTAGVVIDNVAFGSCSSRCYGTNPATAFAWIDLIPGAGYALKVYENGTNEPGIGVPSSETLTNTGNVLAHAQGGGAYTGYPSNLIVTPPVGSIAGVPPYIAAVNAYATANNVALVSITSQWGPTYVAADPAWVSDGSHPSQVGTPNEAAQIEAQIFDALPPTPAGERMEVSSATVAVISPYAKVFFSTATSAPTVYLPVPLTPGLVQVGSTPQFIGRSMEVEVDNFSAGTLTLMAPTGWTLGTGSSVAGGAKVVCKAFQLGTTKNWLCN